MEGLCKHIGAALGAGDAALVITTRPHRDALAKLLRTRGIDTSVAMRQGRYIALDAAETLAKFMVNDLPDASRFSDLIGNVLTQAIAASRSAEPKVTAFGEMVALLLAEGNAEAAIQLENLWNHLARKYPFHLHCAYPMSGFSRQDHGEVFQRICAEHSHVIPTEEYTSLQKEEDKLRSIALLQQKAQALETEVRERQRAEEELRRKHYELQDFFENSVVSLHWVDANGIILWANRAELELLGYSRDEYIGHHIAEFHADQSRINNILHALLCNEVLDKCEASLRCKDGSTRDVLVSSNVLWEDGKFVHTRCFTIDITDRKQAQAALLESDARMRISEERLRLAQKAAKIGSWELDLHSEEYVWSDEVYEMFGLSPNISRPSHSDFLSLMDFSTDRENVQKALRAARSKNREYSTRFRIKLPDGQVRWIAARGRPYYNQGNDLMLGVFIDVTDEEEGVSSSRSAKTRIKRVS